MWADLSIRNAINDGVIGVQPFTERRLQPASLDVTLDRQILMYDGLLKEIDPKRDVSAHMIEHRIGERGLLLGPGEFALATTVETVRLPRNAIARVEGKSSVGRYGLLVHCTAGFVDSGFHGQITLELFNAAPVPFRLYSDMPIAQLAFQWLNAMAENGYAGKYQGQRGPQPSRYHQNWDQERASW